MAFNELFIEPLLKNGFFNPVNTGIFAVILIAAVYLVYRMLGRLQISVNQHFFIALLPFILWAPVTRVLRDFAVAEGAKMAAAIGTQGWFATDLFYQFQYIRMAARQHIASMVPVDALAGGLSAVITVFPTPFSYIITFAFALATLLLALVLQAAGRRVGIRLEYWKTMAAAGFAALLLNMYLLPLPYLERLLPIAFLTLLATGVTYGLLQMAPRLSARISTKGFFTVPNAGIILAHFLDASATYIAITQFGYGEQHFLPRFFFESLGVWSFFLLKPLVIVPILWYLDKDAKEQDKAFIAFLKIAIFILGIAPGLRDSLRLAAGV
ncbi:MAG: DUF63 family protein [Candidatus Aenigmarchaeota archaeon]|nr:DUF63 family protein [Candidatus Aenigmarchaeota archaeon]